jgi:hypothetical protein
MNFKTAMGFAALVTLLAGVNHAQANESTSISYNCKFYDYSMKVTFGNLEKASGSESLIPKSGTVALKFPDTAAWDWVRENGNDNKLQILMPGGYQLSQSSGKISTLAFFERKAGLNAVDAFLERRILGIGPSVVIAVRSLETHPIGGKKIFIFKPNTGRDGLHFNCERVDHP